MTIKITENYYLKNVDLKHTTNIFNMINNEREYFREWLPFIDQIKQKEDTSRSLQRNFIISKDKNLLFSMIYEEKLIGLIGCTMLDEEDEKAEIGYMLSEKAQGRGLVTKAIKSLCQYTFNNLNINRLVIRCAVKNIKSRKIPEKLGFTYEGIEREGEKHGENVFLDIAVYSMLRSDYNTAYKEGQI